MESAWCKMHVLWVISPRASRPLTPLTSAFIERTLGRLFTLMTTQAETLLAQASWRCHTTLSCQSWLIKTGGQYTKLTIQLSDVHFQVLQLDYMNVFNS